jgi:hypothetical protein
MENAMEIWMIWGYPYFRKPPCILYYGAKGTLAGLE